MLSDSLPSNAPANARLASGSSFYLAMRVLPPRQRDAMFGIYGFCRAVDDIADGDAPAPARRELLMQWRRDVDACYDGEVVPGLFALYPYILDFGLARADFHAVIDGMLMDAAPEALCAPDAATLDLYCDRVASAVGRLSVRVFGMARGDGIALAHHLGRALQLTNILRDIDEDAAIGRMYLPREALEEAGVAIGSAGSARAIAADPRLAAACASLVPQVRMHFRHAGAILERNPCRAPRLMGAAYQALLARLVARGWDSPRAAVKVPRLQRIGILLRHTLF
jgi:phytoene synthase